MEWDKFIHIRIHPDSADRADSLQLPAHVLKYN